MHKLPIALLGVSFDNVSLEEACQRGLSLINMNGHDSINRYVCTVNVNFITRVYSTNWNEIIDAELLSAYRKSQMVICDGKPLVWLSRLLGSPLKERVTGADFAPKLANVLAQNDKSIFLLGGAEQINKVTAVILESLNPGLRIAGRLAPNVFTEGENLLYMLEQDAPIIEKINQTSPDLLLIAFGNPKQEKWFDRVKNSLKVPLSIGVGSSFDIISGAVHRAPVWMQKSGMEWLYRLFQEPRRLGKRYFLDIWRFLGIAIPLVGYHTISRILYRISAGRNDTSEMVNPLLFLSTTQTIAMIPLPALVGEDYIHHVQTHFEGTFNQDTIVIDFENVRHITLEGFSLLLKIWQKAQRNGKELYAINISGDTRLLMKVHRIWDLIKDSVMNNPQQVLRALIQGKSHPDYFDSVQQTLELVTVFFFGRIGAMQNQKHYIDKLAPLLREKDCVLDFRYCTYIDNAGFSFLLKLKRIVELKNNQLFVRKRNPLIMRSFKNNQLNGVFADYDKVY